MHINDLEPGDACRVVTATRREGAVTINETTGAIVVRASARSFTVRLNGETVRVAASKVRVER